MSESNITKNALASSLKELMKTKNFEIKDINSTNSNEELLLSFQG